MQRNTMTRRKFLQGIAVTSLGVVGAQSMVACTAPIPAAGTTPATDA